MKTTRQGVRDLTPRGHNGRKGCRHFFGGPLVSVGYTWERDPLDGQLYRAEVLGWRCVWCKETREAT